jgi:hypothetical protein
MPGHVTFSDYALSRMRQRDILREEVLATLEAPRGRHKNRKDGRSEVRQRIRTRTLLVVYSRSARMITVINAMWE